jgi:hypothetical protein
MGTKVVSDALIGKSAPALRQIEPERLAIFTTTMTFEVSP